MLTLGSLWEVWSVACTCPFQTEAIAAKIEVVETTHWKASECPGRWRTVNIFTWGMEIDKHWPFPIHCNLETFLFYVFTFITTQVNLTHYDVIKWKHFPRYWFFVWGFHRWQVNSPHRGQWRGAVMFSLIFVWTNDWVNNRDAGDLRRHRAHYDVTVMLDISKWVTSGH